MSVPVHPPLERLFADPGAGTPLRAWSFLITLFGDAIVPRGGAVDSATVQAITGRIGIEPGTVRTAFSRLGKDGWIERRRVGRGSVYSLSPSGRAPFEAASRRIYAAPGEARDERPRVLAIGERAGAADVPDDPTALELRTNLWLLVDRGPERRAALEAAGYLVTSAEPGTPPDWLVERLGLHDLAAELNGLATRYAAFAGASPENPLDATVLRLLLIHDWRRALLHTPVLPPALQPPGWPLAAVRRRVAELYLELLPPSSRWLDGCGETLTLPADDASVRRRFGGGESDESLLG